MSFDLLAPRSVEQLAADCRAKLENDAQEFPSKRVEVIPMTEAFLDLSERVLRLENAMGLGVTHGRI
jgi:hypothetical protein